MALRFTALGYQIATSYLTLEAGSHEAHFVRADTSAVVLGPIPFQVCNGSIETFALTDPEAGTLELLAVEDSLSAP